MSAHLCHWHGCTVDVPPDMWGCRKHWGMLPVAIRGRILFAYRRGQEIDKNPSDEYLEAALEAQRFARSANAVRSRKATP